jgi:hypothetical protein
MMRTRKQLPSAPTVVDVAKDMQAADESMRSSLTILELP